MWPLIAHVLAYFMCPMCIARRAFKSKEGHGQGADSCCAYSHKCGHTLGHWMCKVHHERQRGKSWNGRNRRRSLATEVEMSHQHPNHHYKLMKLFMSLTMWLLAITELRSWVRNNCPFYHARGLAIKLPTSVEICIVIPPYEDQVTNILFKKFWSSDSTIICVFGTQYLDPTRL